MYFREKHNKATQNPVIQLVESFRHNGTVRQRVVLSLDRETEIPWHLRKQIAKAVENRLRGIQELWNDPEVQRYAEPLAQRIIRDGKWNGVGRERSPGEGKQETGETAQVYVDSVDHSTNRELGPCLIGHTFWQRLGLDDILTSHGFNSEQKAAAEISVLNRLIAGDSEYALTDWIQTAAVSDLLGVDAEKYGKDRFYRISDTLWRASSPIEKQLYANERDLFGGQSTLVLYDLTNTFFAGDGKKNPKAQRNGNQKEKRTDRPQIVVALVLDGEGFCRRHFVFEGKMADSTSLQYILDSLSEEFKQESAPTVIVDRGVANAENLDLIHRHYNLDYIVAAVGDEKSQFQESFKTDNFHTISHEDGNQVKVRVEQRPEANYLLCKSTGRAKKEEAIRTRKEQHLEAELNTLRNRIKGGTVRLSEQVQQKIGRLREKYSSVAKYYKIAYTPYRFEYTIKNPDNVSQRVKNILARRKRKADTLEMNYVTLSKEIQKYREKYPGEFNHLTAKVIEPELQWWPQEEKELSQKQLEGNYVLKTNRNDLSDNQIWHTYVMLTRVEKAFRNLKSDLALRPNYHQKEYRVEGHVFISVLAYHLLHAIEYTLRQKGETMSWATIKRVMASHAYATIKMPTKDGKMIHVRKAGEAEEIHKNIYEKLNIDYKNLKTSKVYA